MVLSAEQVTYQETETQSQSLSGRSRTFYPKGATLTPLAFACSWPSALPTPSQCTPYLKRKKAKALGGKGSLEGSPPALLFTCPGHRAVSGRLSLFASRPAAQKCRKDLPLRSFSAESMIGMTEGQPQAWSPTPLGLMKFQEPGNFKQKAQNSKNLSMGDGGVGGARVTPLMRTAEDGWRGTGPGLL